MLYSEVKLIRLESRSGTISSGCEVIRLALRNAGVLSLLVGASSGMILSSGTLDEVTMLGSCAREDLREKV